MAPRKTTPAEMLPDDLFEVFAPSVFPIAGGTGADVIIGEFVAVTQGPENEYGTPFVVEFSAIAGRSLVGALTDETFDLVPGEHYSLWLMSQTLLESFLEARPIVGESFAVKHFGRTLKKGADPTKDKSHYNLVKAVFPEREKVEKVLTWDDVPAPAKKSDAPF